MPTQKEIMQRIVDLVGAGAGGSVPPAVEAALRKRYNGWIVAKKKGNSTSPKDIWDTKEGERIQKQLGKIGKRLAEKTKQKTDLTAADCDDACREVEVASACPHCPEPPEG
jgi:hypothetical protein